MGVERSDLSFGSLAKGEKNKITDVPGVRVGHVTLSDGEIQTGVTAIIPGEGSCFMDKFPAAAHVINGFGKSIGLMQVNELGTLETPVILTNTFSVPACAEGLLDYMLADHHEIGVTTGTVNPVVMECNDGGLNAIRERNVTPGHVLEALENAGEDFEEGAVGAGRGMRCYSFKGGIGSASRVITLCGEEYTLGALLLTNFGSKKDLTVCGRRLWQEHTEAEADKGSCIIILATDAPLSCRQLGRCARRAQNGLARTGTITGGGSGDVVLMFSTANRVPHGSTELISASVIAENELELLFRAVADTVEESVISSLLHAETVCGVRGNKTLSIIDAGLLPEEKKADGIHILSAVKNSILRRF